MDRTADNLAWLIALDRSDGLERQIYRQILTAVLDRRLRPGARLPPSRSLAADLGISRGTVVAAYDQLVAEGFLESRPGSGTTVAVLPEALLGATANTDSGAGPSVAPSRRGLDFSLPSTDGALTPRCFQPGMPSLDDFPRADWSRCLVRRARGLRVADMTYQNAAGLPILREALAGYLNRARGVAAEPDQVVIVPSAQAAFVATALCATDPGAVTVIEDPGYHNARRLLSAAGATLVPVPVDDAGIDVDVLSKLDHVRLVAVTPSHQYPTGATMSLERRLRLIEIARAKDAIILEDDYDSEFRYAERPIASLQGLDGGRNVIYIGTFSKSLAPGIRAAYLVAPRSLAPVLGKITAGLGQIVSGPVQAALADFINEGYLTAHVGRMRGVYAAKRDALVAALNKFLPEVTVSAPRGGLQLMLPLPVGTDDAAVAADLAQAGIESRSISSLSIQANDRGLLLGFALPRLDEIAPAARRLAGIVRRHIHS